MLRIDEHGIITCMNRSYRIKGAGGYNNIIRIVEGRAIRPEGRDLETGLPVIGIATDVDTGEVVTMLYDKPNICFVGESKKTRKLDKLDKSYMERQSRVIRSDISDYMDFQKISDLLDVDNLKTGGFC